MKAVSEYPYAQRTWRRLSAVTPRYDADPQETAAPPKQKPQTVNMACVMSLKSYFQGCGG